MRKRDGKAIIVVFHYATWLNADLPTLVVGLRHHQLRECGFRFAKK